MENATVSGQEIRERVFSLFYYASLAVLGCVVAWHWLFGVAYGFFGAVAVWSILAFSVLGLLNSLGIFGKR